MIVADTNVIVSACRSRNGASFIVLRGMLTGDIEFAISPAVICEYEDVLKRPGILGDNPAISLRQVDTILDALCAKAIPTSPWFRFRRFLNDPRDDLVIECALAAGARFIVTGDRHFKHPAVTAFGLMTMTAGDFVAKLSREGYPK